MPRMHEQELTVRTVMAMSPSELCNKTGCQNCHFCDRDGVDEKILCKLFDVIGKSG